MNKPAIIPSETTIFPTGVDPNDEDQHYMARSFVVIVRWQGHLGWVVAQRFPDIRLSVKGRKWGNVSRRQRRFYYFKTREEAIQAAIEAVDDVKINGRTWAEWENIKT